MVGVPGNFKVNGFPQDVRDQVDAQLLSNNFRDYAQLEVFLADLGYEISVSSLHRYGVALRDRVQALRDVTFLAQQLKADMGDDVAAIAQVGLQFTMGELFQRAYDPDEPLSLGELLAVIDGMAKGARTYTTVRNYQAEHEARVAAAAEKVAGMGRQGGLSEETIAQIEAEILGITRSA